MYLCFIFVFGHLHSLHDDDEDDESSYWDSEDSLTEVHEDSDTGPFETIETHYTKAYIFFIRHYFMLCWERYEKFWHNGTLSDLTDLACLVF